MNKQLLILLLLAVPIFAQAETIKIGIPQNLELFDSHYSQTGEVEAALAHTFALVGIKTELVFLPLNRLRSEILLGNIDAAFPWISRAAHNKGLLISDSVYMTFVYILSHKQATVSATDLLENKRKFSGATVAAGIMGPKIDYLESIGKLKLVRTKSYRKAVDLLAKKRVDLVLIDKIVANKILSRHPLAKRLVLSDSPICMRQIHMAFAPDKEKYLQAFTKAYRQVVQQQQWVK